MEVVTSRFGTLDIDENRVITFDSGLLGFAEQKRFALLQTDDEGVFFWLQSLDRPELAFVVTDPVTWAPGYQAQIRAEQMEEIELADPDRAQVMVIVNKRDRILTGNLQGPLVINALTRRGIQLVLADRTWSTQHRLIQLAEPARALSA